MGVPLHLILGIFLAVLQCNFAKGTNFRSIREAPSPTAPAPNQNVTEINNRDLNKIITDNPKTEILESKTKSVVNVHSIELPLTLSKSEDDDNGDSGISNKQEVKVKDEGKKTTKLSKEKRREDNSRAIDSDVSKFWSSDFHNKNNVFTLPPIPDIEKFHEPEEFSFDSTHRSSFFPNFELTTPKDVLFDKKYKETVESVDQKLEEIDREHGHNHHEDEEEEGEVEEGKDDEFNIEDVLSKPHNGTMDYVKVRTIVNNETVDKNSIHKDLSVEQIKKIDFENVYNDTKTYNEETTESSTTEKISSTTMEITKKPTLVKESVNTKSNTHILSNNIDTETREPIKFGTSTVVPGTTRKVKEEYQNTVVTFQTTPNSLTQKIKPQVTTTLASPLLKINISDQENHIVPINFDSEKTSKNREKFSVSQLPKINDLEEFSKDNHNITARLAQESTTEIFSTTEIQEIQTDFDISTITPEYTSTFSTEEGTTFLITQAFEPTTDLSTITSAITEEIASTESMQRTSKSLDKIVTESEAKTTDTSTIIVEDGTEATSTAGDMGSITTVQNEKSIEENVIVASDKTTTEIEVRSTTLDGDTTVSTVSEFITTENIMEVSTETETPDIIDHTTTEFAFVHIEVSGNNHTTLLPETLSPNLNYSTPIASGIGPRKNIINYNGTTTDLPYTTSAINTSDDFNINSTTTTEDNTETIPTENGLTKDNDENKGKIAAIAISSVGAVCLVVLAGLLYVMKKRQRRLNYGPRCRPVSLDDYSIDNLSVYNSVRRKGERMSKRSFGNPAFEDPTSPTHPLNFQALANFSTNTDDIRAEYEEIPQISARTSELPEGCETRNRYANVIPLPETRVFLTPIEGYDNSDYINANYITGPKNSRGYYIATQGPMQNTVDEFWRMIWEQHAKVILMLTHLVENGLEKCVDYLPESEIVDCSRLFGDFQIILKRREVKEKYIISSLQLKNMVSNSWREITHFWYLGWPDKGVPSEANSLIAFLIEARSYMKTTTLDKNDAMNGIQNGRLHNEHNPVVVHCSPGTGRTGVAIACDIAIREFETTRLVDIPKIVYRIRRDRAGAVQTKEQYQFIYKVVSLYATKLTGGALDNF